MVATVLTVLTVLTARAVELCQTLTLITLPSPHPHPYPHPRGAAGFQSDSANLAGWQSMVLMVLQGGRATVLTMLRALTDARYSADASTV